ncbi:hypothetical protein [Thauera sp.]|uniref:hypothetical protein n=1 Tax=Thauera sp. TaxID=1905334 RepID=UPI00257D7A15|nr:hypothetical protein [Thauera sp.]
MSTSGEGTGPRPRRGLGGRGETLAGLHFGRGALALREVDLACLGFQRTGALDGVKALALGLVDAPVHQELVVAARLGRLERGLGLVAQGFPLCLELGPARILGDALRAFGCVGFGLWRRNRLGEDGRRQRQQGDGGQGQDAAGQGGEDAEAGHARKVPGTIRLARRIAPLPAFAALRPCIRS